MPELSQTERLTIAAVVDGMQARTRSRRKAARQGWALLITGALAMPIIASALDGMITFPTALIRIVLAMAITYRQTDQQDKCVQGIRQKISPG